MSVVVTGASGFLGRRLAEILVGRRESVRLLARSTSRIDDLGEGCVEIVRCAFDDGPGLARALAGARLVYHCAGHSSDWGPWVSFRRANVEAVAALLAAAHASGSVARFVHVSTTDVYGYPRQPGDETAPLRDVGLPYNRSKLLGDRLALTFGARTGLPVTVVRPATIIGPKSKDWVLELARLLRRRQVITLDGGRTNAGLVYVDDVAEAMIRLAGTTSAAGRAFNVVDPRPFTWRQYFDLIADQIGAPRPWIDLDSRLALGIAAASEAVYRVLRRQQRPLFTRHIVLVLSRDQGYRTDRLSAAIGQFPIVGVERGLAETIVWLRRAEDSTTTRDSERGAASVPN